MLSKTDLTEKVLVLWVLPFQQPFQIILLKNLTKCIFVDWKTPLERRQKDNHRKTYSWEGPMREQLQFQNQPLDGAVPITSSRDNSGKPLCLISFRNEMVFTHLLKLKNWIRLFLNIWFDWLVCQWWLLDCMAEVNIYLLKVFPWIKNSRCQL